MQINYSTSIPETVQRFDETRVTINFDVIKVKEEEGENLPEYQYKSILAPIEEAKRYEAVLIVLIREKYSTDDEVSILRKKDSKPSEFREYNLYVNMCKYRAKRITKGTVDLEDAKGEKIAMLDFFDNLESSEGVNWFYLGTFGMWLNKDLRQSLNYTREKEQKIGSKTMTVWYGTQSFTLPLDVIDTMLTQLEIYASTCYNVTARHKAAINALTTIDDVDNYDFKTGYPEKLIFNL